MDRVFFSDFSALLEEYQEPRTREDKLIKHKLHSIVALCDSCDAEERQFVDEITLEFSRIIALLKNQHRQELRRLSQEYQDAKEEMKSANAPYPMAQDQDCAFENDYQLLSAFYEYFKRPGDDQLSYCEIERYEFKDEKDRKTKVNLTIFDYCNRIKTFCNKYLHEMHLEGIPRAFYGEGFDGLKSSKRIVFVYNNLELILAKMKITDENGETSKQKLNIRSALRKLNEFKQETEW